MRTWLWRIPWLMVATCCLYLGSYRWHLELLTLTPIEPQAMIRGMMAEDHFADAADQVQYFQDIAEDQERDELAALAAELASHRSSVSYQTQKIVQEGLLIGSSDEVSGQIAGLASSLLVIGDVRDLLKEGVHWLHDEPMDEVIVTLATIGLVASAGQVVTLGSSSPVKTGITVIKQAHQLGTLPPWLRAYLMQISQQALAVRSLVPLLPMMHRLQTLLDAAGWRQALIGLGMTRDPGSLNRLAILARHLGPAMGPLVRLGGDAALVIAPQVERLGIANLKLASRYGPQGLHTLVQVGPVRFVKYGARLAKWGYTFPLLATLSKYLLKIPPVMWVVGTILGLLFGLPWPWRKILLS